MNMYIALFRGINVGGKTKLPMKDLVSILETLDYESIQTYIQSGNVVFRSKKKIGENEIDEIRREILDKKGFEPNVILFSVEQLQKAIKDNPFATDEGKALHFFFLESEPPNPKLKQLDSLKIESEKFKLIGNVFYLYAPNGVGRSKLAAAVEKSIGVPVTARNWNTVSKIASIVEGL
jgi:uncharacterized protein (DUF1697 family)